jgi:hypothetical protein
VKNTKVQENTLIVIQISIVSVFVNYHFLNGKVLLFVFPYSKSIGISKTFQSELVELLKAGVLKTRNTGSL